MSHACPEYCHFCPDMGGEIMPRCWGVVERHSLDYCHCAVEEESAKELGRRLTEERFLPAEIREALQAWVDAPARGRA